MQPSVEAKFSRSEMILWFAGSAIIAVAIAWIATAVADRFAPLLISPVVVGVVLGAALVGFSRLFAGSTLRTMLATAVLASFVAVGAQHYFCYLEAERKMRESKTLQNAQLVFADAMRDRLPRGPIDYLRAEAAMGRAMPFGYVARGWAAWLSWAFDGLLLMCAATGMAFFSVKEKPKPIEAFQNIDETQ